MILLQNLFIEIKQDKRLSLYGISLSLAYILSIFFWYQTGGVQFASTDEPWCWPFYSDCWQHRATIYQVASFMAVLGVMASLSLTYFVYNKINRGCIYLFITWLLTLLLVVQDFRFRSNQFYMLSWVTLVYLFAPSKRTSIPAVIIAFYFWAGRLKLNWEWISGSGLYEKLWLIPESLTIAACVYVIVLEMILVWGLVSKRKWIFCVTMTQLIAFHLQSFSQVAYWYPWLMFLLLSFFVFDRIISNPTTNSQSIYISSWGRSAWLVFILFSLCQLNPIVYADTPLRVSSWRFLALHMFEAKYICDVQIEKILQDSAAQALPVQLPLAPRMKCDPVIYWNHARNRCREWSAEPQFVSLQMTINYKKSSNDQSRKISILCDKNQNIEVAY